MSRPMSIHRSNTWHMLQEVCIIIAIIVSLCLDIDRTHIWHINIAIIVSLFSQVKVAQNNNVNVAVGISILELDVGTICVYIFFPYVC